MEIAITELQIVPVKPKDGLVAFASFILNNNLYLGSIAIVTRPEGGFRLLYPTKKVGDNRSINIFFPINKNFAEKVESEVLRKFEEIKYL